MSRTINLRGITWDHSRGFCPMVATGQRYSETHNGVTIEWAKRSLQQFADEPIEILADKYDLLVIDHPWAGFAAKSGIIQALDQLLPSSFLEDLARHSVGKSYESYCFDGHLFALPIDAATPVAASRHDMLQQRDLALPKTYAELLQLAQTGCVTMPGIPIDTLMNFYMMCGGLGEDPLENEEVVVSENIGVQALQMLKALTDCLDPEFFDWNPIQVYEAMTNREDLIYCPWAYGYSNYSRRGYARTKLRFHDVIVLDADRSFRTTLGGTGLAISARCNHLDEAIAYVSYVASPLIQKTLYFDNGGQPGHRRAWQDDYVNKMSDDFFRSTLKTLDHAFLRPRYDGYMHFQDHAGALIREYLMNGGSAQEVLASLNAIYSTSRISV